MLQILALAASLVAVAAEGPATVAPESATPTYLAMESGIKAYIECVTDHALEQEPSGKPAEALAQAALRHCIKERGIMVEALSAQGASLGEAPVEARSNAATVASDMDDQLEKDTVRLVRGVRAQRT